MATASTSAGVGEPSEAMRLSYIREGDDIMTETLPIIFIISDSWMRIKKSTGRMDPQALMSHIDISPHRVTLSIRPAERSLPAYSFVQECHYRQFVKSSLTFDLAVSQKEEIRKWAMEVPRVTVTHLGSVDVASTDLAKEKNNIRKLYPEMVENFLNKWVNTARDFFKNKPRQLRMFDAKMKKHKWLLIGVSDWGTSDQIRGVTAEEHRHNRRLANTGMENKQNKFYRNHRAFIFKPQIDNPEFHNGGIHLAPKSQELFLEKIFGVASRLACDFCQNWSTEEFIKKDHKELREEFGKCRGAHVPLLNPQY